MTCTALGGHYQQKVDPREGSVIKGTARQVLSAILPGKDTKND